MDTAAAGEEGKSRATGGWEVETAPQGIDVLSQHQGAGQPAGTAKGSCQHCLGEARNAPDYSISGSPGEKNREISHSLGVRKKKENMKEMKAVCVSYESLPLPSPRSVLLPIISPREQDTSSRGSGSAWPAGIAGVPGKHGGRLPFTATSPLTNLLSC